MFSKTTLAGLALGAAFTATAANAHGTHSSGTTSGQHSPSYAATTYTFPTIDLGPIETVQPASTVSYSAPYYVQPSAQTTTYSVPTYVQPAITTAYPAPTYIAPSAYVRPYDATGQIRKRLKRQRHRIERAEARGDLQAGELKKLRKKMHRIRRTFRAYRDNDGVISSWEQQELNRKLDRQSRRIARLANNHRTVQPVVYAPYVPYSVY